MFEHISKAIEKRRDFMASLHQEDTNCYRVFHGATEGLPGLSIDRYGQITLIQTWRDLLKESQAKELMKLVNDRLNEPLYCIWNHRQKKKIFLI